MNTQVVFAVTNHTVDFRVLVTDSPEVTAAKERLAASFITPFLVMKRKYTVSKHHNNGVTLNCHMSYGTKAHLRRLVKYAVELMHVGKLERNRIFNVYFEHTHGKIEAKFEYALPAPGIGVSGYTVVFSYKDEVEDFFIKHYHEELEIERELQDDMSNFLYKYKLRWPQFFHDQGLLADLFEYEVDEEMKEQFGETNDLVIYMVEQSK